MGRYRITDQKGNEIKPFQIVIIIVLILVGLYIYGQIFPDTDLPDSRR